MANSAQVEKRVRQAVKANLRNKSTKSEINTYKKNVISALNNQKLDEAKNNFNKMVSLLFKAVSKKIIHKKTASRWVSRLNTKIKAAS